MKFSQTLSNQNLVMFYSILGLEEGSSDWTKIFSRKLSTTGNNYMFTLLLAYFRIDPCALRADGKYLTRDIFQYMQCTDNVATYVKCVSQYFDPTSKTCVGYGQLSKDSFCQDRPNSNYIDPWNCHKFINCSNGDAYVFNCSTPDLVYDPTSDICQPAETKVCKQVNGKHSNFLIFQGLIDFYGACPESSEYLSIESNI